MKRLLSSSLLSLAWLLLLSASARAQFIGFTSPQTVQQVLFANVACTGGLQRATVLNLGQAQHLVTVINTGGVTPTFMDYFLEGSVDNINFTRISDEALPLSFGSLQASGYYPIVRLTVTCLPVTSNFTANYSGTSVTPLLPVGDALAAQFQKRLVLTQGAGANFSSQIFRLPFANTNGLLVFTYSGAGPAGSTLQVQCLDVNGLNTTWTTTYSLSTSGNFQIFPVGAQSCFQAAIVYTSGGVSAQTFNLEYLVAVPGTGFAADPCGPSMPKQSAVITAAAAATSQIVALVANQTIYPCGFSVTGGGGAGTMQWVTGTGVNCGTGTSNLSGAFTTAIAGLIAFSPGGTAFKVPAGQAVCVTMVGAGATGAGVLTFVQQ